MSPLPERTPRSLRAIVQEFVHLCEIGDIDEHTDDGLGWGALVREAKAALARPIYDPIGILTVGDGPNPRFAWYGEAWRLPAGEHRLYLAPLSVAPLVPAAKGQLALPAYPPPAPPAQCQRRLREQGKAYPRTCAVCGLGPCQQARRHTDPG